MAGIETNFVGGKESKGMFEGMCSSELLRFQVWYSDESGNGIDPGGKEAGERKVWNPVQILVWFFRQEWFLRDGFAGLFEKVFFEGFWRNLVVNTYGVKQTS